MVSTSRWETNGTLVPVPELARDVDQWNVSPKLATSGNLSERRNLPQVLETFSLLPNSYFKFVIVEPEDIQEVCSLVDGNGLARDRVILMPEGRTPETIKARSGWLSQACVQEGFRFSTRLHILLWGDERGR